ncbi:SUMF1/EgtB/PvdO family nonheme iron enzyme [Posidoniimonas polymericola]|uniref:SUMF1/EgtB/PvdO family nonheme iron enzyme n=1 Tax=Posidoniimonas polymericola TaxID=2528002 RepID=UPI001E40B6C3|nr:SUMF1/EgtB/PvdO family nonheme iron enzyme [Posidoniimonas polymericola]
MWSVPAVMVAALCSRGASAVDFASDVQPILEQQCLSCHNGEDADSGYDLSTRAAVFDDDYGEPLVAPGKPDESPLFTTMNASADADELMPPADAGGPLDKQSIETIRVWIADGAQWPNGVTLRPRAKPVDRSATPDNRQLLEEIHAKIVNTAAESAGGEMADYRGEIPRTGVPYEMKAIPAGTFPMGSPADEANRQANEGPQTEVGVGAFWMGAREVSWDEYEPFMISSIERRKNGARKDYDPAKHTAVDAVSAPTAPYMEMSFGMGQSGYPAISMTQHAANKYCQWLSAQTGHFYRLPTEAEWEYACRAGATTAYSFGDDPARLGEHAWFYDNSNEKYQKVGMKKPNPWGLYDMHGNVSEWTADQYAADYFAQISGQAENPFLKPTTLYPRSVRGGSWYDDPEQLRSAYRTGSDPIWKQQDPQLPKSIWYHTDAQWLGFRIVRPRRLPTVDEMDAFWNSAANLIK